jgi:hypothetical protein
MSVFAYCARLASPTISSVKAVWFGLETANRLPHPNAKSNTKFGTKPVPTAVSVSARPRRCKTCTRTRPQSQACLDLAQLGIVLEDCDCDALA